MEFKGYHTHEGRAGHVQFSFTPSLHKETQAFQGFAFSILRDGKEKFFLPLTPGEAENLTVFLDFYLKMLYQNRFRMPFIGEQAAPAAPAPDVPADTFEEPSPQVESEPAAGDQGSVDENPFS